MTREQMIDEAVRRYDKQRPDLLTAARRIASRDGNLGNLYIYPEDMSAIWIELLRIDDPENAKIIGDWPLTTFDITAAINGLHARVRQLETARDCRA